MLSEKIKDKVKSAKLEEVKKKIQVSFKAFSIVNTHFTWNKVPQKNGKNFNILIKFAYRKEQSSQVNFLARLWPLLLKN